MSTPEYHFPGGSLTAFREDRPEGWLPTLFVGAPPVDTFPSLGQPRRELWQTIGGRGLVKPRPRGIRALVMPPSPLQPGAGDDGGLTYQQASFEQVGIERLVQRLGRRGGQPDVHTLEQQQPR
jgi:hypothetical protein